MRRWISGTAGNQQVKAERWQQIMKMRRWGREEGENRRKDDEKKNIFEAKNLSRREKNRKEEKRR